MFLTPACLDADISPDMWIVAAPLVWNDAVFGRVEVPCGFRTDLASIPRAVRLLPQFDPNGISRRPAIVHDWLYAWRGWSKARADLFLEAALLAEGETPRVASLFYYGVKWFGNSSWANDAGALETRDFDTPQHFATWKASTAVLSSVS